MIALFFSQDQKVRLYNWDGKGLQEAAVLEANRGLVSALAFSPDGLKLAAGDVSTPSNLIAICFMPDFFHHDLAKKKNTPFRLVTPCVGADRFRPILTYVRSYRTVKWESHPLRRREARGDHLPLVLPFRARKRVELDRGLATLRLWCARYAHIRLERPEAPEEHSDQECGAWGRQRRAVAVRRLRVQGGQQVGRHWRRCSHQGVAS